VRRVVVHQVAILLEQVGDDSNLTGGEAKDEERGESIAKGAEARDPASGLLKVGVERVVSHCEQGLEARVEIEGEGGESEKGAKG